VPQWLGLTSTLDDLNCRPELSEAQLGAVDTPPVWPDGSACWSICLGLGRELVLRFIASALLLLSGIALSACSSDGVPSWALAAAQHQSLTGRVAPRSISEAKANRPPQTIEKAKIPPLTAETVDNSKPGPPKVNETHVGNVPAKYKDLATQLHQWDSRQEEENRRVNAAIEICRC
jgi:hypothetical protein